jgi:transcriptional regulator with XRE-family HTH domain
MAEHEDEPGGAAARPAPSRPVTIARFLTLYCRALGYDRGTLAAKANIPPDLLDSVMRGLATGDSAAEFTASPHFERMHRQMQRENAGDPLTAERFTATCVRQLKFDRVNQAPPPWHRWRLAVANNVHAPPPPWVSMVEPTMVPLIKYQYEYLRALRGSICLTQDKMATLLDITIDDYRMLEAGKPSPQGIRDTVTAKLEEFFTETNLFVSDAYQRLAYNEAEREALASREQAEKAAARQRTARAWLCAEYGKEPEGSPYPLTVGGFVQALADMYSGGVVAEWCRMELPHGLDESEWRSLEAYGLIAPDRLASLIQWMKQPNVLGTANAGIKLQQLIIAQRLPIARPDLDTDGYIHAPDYLRLSTLPPLYWQQCLEAANHELAGTMMFSPPPFYPLVRPRMQNEYFRIGRLMLGESQEDFCERFHDRHALSVGELEAFENNWTALDFDKEDLRQAMAAYMATRSPYFYEKAWQALPLHTGQQPIAPTEKKANPQKTESGISHYLNQVNQYPLDIARDVPAEFSRMANTEKSYAHALFGKDYTDAEKAQALALLGRDYTKQNYIPVKDCIPLLCIATGMNLMQLSRESGVGIDSLSGWIAGDPRRTDQQEAFQKWVTHYLRESTPFPAATSAQTLKVFTLAFEHDGNVVTAADLKKERYEEEGAEAPQDEGVAVSQPIREKPILSPDIFMGPYRPEHYYIAQLWMHEGIPLPKEWKEKHPVEPIRTPAEYVKAVKESHRLKDSDFAQLVGVTTAKYQNFVRKNAKTTTPEWAERIRKGLEILKDDARCRSDVPFSAEIFSASFGIKKFNYNVRVSPEQATKWLKALMEGKHPDASLREILFKILDAHMIEPAALAEYCGVPKPSVMLWLYKDTIPRNMEPIRLGLSALYPHGDDASKLADAMGSVWQKRRDAQLAAQSTGVQASVRRAVEPQAEGALQQLMQPMASYLSNESGTAIGHFYRYLAAAASLSLSQLSTTLFGNSSTMRGDIEENILPTPEKAKKVIAFITSHFPDERESGHIIEAFHASRVADWVYFRKQHEAGEGVRRDYDLLPVPALLACLSQWQGKPVQEKWARQFLSALDLSPPDRMRDYCRLVRAAFEIPKEQFADWCRLGERYAQFEENGTGANILWNLRTGFARLEEELSEQGIYFSPKLEDILEWKECVQRDAHAPYRQYNPSALPARATSKQLMIAKRSADIDHSGTDAKPMPHIDGSDTENQGRMNAGPAPMKKRTAKATQSRIDALLNQQSDDLKDTTFPMLLEDLAQVNGTNVEGLAAKSGAAHVVMGWHRGESPKSLDPLRNALLALGVPGEDIADITMLAWEIVKDRGKAANKNGK